LFSKSDPFLILYRSSNPSKHTNKVAKAKNKKKQDKLQKKGHASWSIVTKTEHVDNNQSPTWRPFNVDLQALCDNNADHPLLLEVFDWDINGNHDLIGRAQTSLRSIQIMKELPLTNPKRFGLTKNAGMIHLMKAAPLVSVAHVASTPAAGAGAGAAAGHPPAAGGHPPQQGGYPPQQGYPPQDIA